MPINTPSPVVIKKAAGLFDGLSSVTILATKGISGIVRNSAGNYTVTMTSALANINYFVSLAVNGNFTVCVGTASRTTTSFQILTITSGTPTDATGISFEVSE